MYSLEALAAAELQLGRAERGLPLLGAAAALRRETGLAVSPFQHELRERALTDAAAALGEDRVSAALSDRVEHDLVRVIADALKSPP